MTFDEVMVHIFKSEGGYVNDPDDPGGETNFGISKEHHPNEDISGMTKERAKEIYKESYWDKIRGDELGYLSGQVMDMAVNAGVSTAIKLMQEEIGVVADGIIGSKTLNALFNKNSWVEVSRGYFIRRVSYYHDICSRRRSSRKYLYAWVKRSIEIYES